MSNNYFFNEYGYRDTMGFESARQQLKKEGVDIDGCQEFDNGFGKCTDEGFTPSEYDGTFMSRKKQLKDSGVKCDYTLTFGKGFEAAE